jgi:hypothetical protein
MHLHSTDAPPRNLANAGPGRGCLRHRGRPQAARCLRFAFPARSAPAIKKGLTKVFSVCFMLSSCVAAVANIASFCCTDNHWSDDVTSKAYVQDVVVPYFRMKIEELLKEGIPCKPFGKQVCVLIIDCWWGWLDAGFRSWVKERYPVRTALLSSRTHAHTRAHKKTPSALHPLNLSPCAPLLLPSIVDSLALRARELHPEGPAHGRWRYLHAQGLLASPIRQMGLRPHRLADQQWGEA